MKLLPQEQDMFPETIQRHSPPGSADDILSLPNKATCTVQEASVATGVSQSQIKYWVEDGTLLAINSARHPVSGQRRRKNERRTHRGHEHDHRPPTLPRLHGLPPLGPPPQP